MSQRQLIILQAQEDLFVGCYTAERLKVVYITYWASKITLQDSPGELQTIHEQCLVQAAILANVKAAEIALQNSTWLLRSTCCPLVWFEQLLNSFFLLYI